VRVNRASVCLRNAAVSPAGAPLVFEDRHIYAMQLSVFAQTPLVADRRLVVLRLRGAQAVVDHPDADRLGLGDAVDVVHGPSVSGQR
jgi:hypothetical protein